MSTRSYRSDDHSSSDTCSRVSSLYLSVCRIVYLCICKGYEQSIQPILRRVDGLNPLKTSDCTMQEDLSNELQAGSSCVVLKVPLFRWVRGRRPSIKAKRTKQLYQSCAIRDLMSWLADLRMCFIFWASIDSRTLAIQADIRCSSSMAFTLA